MNEMKLITPTCELVDVFNSFWTSKPKTTIVKLFENDGEEDIKKYIEKGKFKDYEGKDDEIKKTQDLQKFLERINGVYHTRISGKKPIEDIKTMLEKVGINNKCCLVKRIKNGELSLPTFVGYCKEATGQYTYSFASKVFSFIDEDKYPIIDSFVATLLNAYEYDKKINKSEWGDYSQYVNNYYYFKRQFELEELSFKKIDKFLWTYAKILSYYWSDLGVLSYQPIAFDPKSLNGIIA